MISPHKWEVLLAKVCFEDVQVFKLRPVLVAENGCAAYIMSYKITGHPPRVDFPMEYVIKDWNACGLDKQSTVRLSKKLCIPLNDFERKLGVLSANDIFCVYSILNSK